MKPADYCIDRAHEAGFDHLYRFLFQTDEQHVACLAIRALESHFDELIEQSSQSEVAITQLSWWSEELARLRHGEARHPISKTLSATGYDKVVDEALGAGWLAAVSIEVENPVPADDADWRTRLSQRHAAADAAVATILGARDAQNLDRFTTARAMARQYLELGKLVRGGFLALPQATLQSAGISPADILHPQSRDALTPILKAIADESAELLRTAMHSVNGEHAAGLAGLFATGEVQLALLSLLRDRPADVLEQKTSLTAVRQVLVSRRARGRARRSARK